MPVRPERVALPLLLLAAVSACGTGAAVDRAAGPAASAPPARHRAGFGPGRQASPAVPHRAFPAYSATGRGAPVAVHTRPDGPVVRTLADPQPSGAPLVFLVRARTTGWLQVQLPVRPNGSTGWVRSGDVGVAGLAYRVDVHLRAHRLDLYEYGARRSRYPVGVGRQQTPTPGGTFYLKELLRPPDPRGAYGPFAYGLSGFSSTLTSFAGGDGVIGLHGTDDPTAVGRDVSHGCIRLRNADITALSRLLPLGTPVRILA